MGWFWTASSTLVLLAGAWTLARDGFRQPPGFPRLLGTAILAWAWVTLGVEILGNLGLLRDLWLVGWSGVLGLVALGIRGYRGRLADERTGDVTRDQRAGWVGMMALGLVLWGWMRVAFPSLVAPVKVVSDGPIYHLYMAARWWKAGRLFLVPTPFGDGATGWRRSARRRFMALRLSRRWVWLAAWGPRCRPPGWRRPGSRRVDLL
jgi:hypothetical protein